MNPSEIRQALATLGRGANKSLGQHFLIDRATLRAVADAGHVTAGDVVVEIGPGLGVLTKELLTRGATVIAIERDRGLAEYVRTAFASEAAEGRFRVLDQDAADGEWLAEVATGPWKLISNLPYGITSLALRLALWAPHPPTHLSVLIQKEVAERIIDKEKTSLLSLMVGLASRSTRFMRRVPPGAFFPPPRVDSAVLLAEALSQEERQARWGMAPERVMHWAKRGFAHPRKLLFSNLLLSPEEKASLVEAGYLGTVRAEELSVEEWVDLAKRLEALEKTS
ncbi:MAG: rRNA (adenine1518-N6/adenine1519-N6)-dimethyltransferase [Patescibacteria group bacterium]|nr:rRNA (adenine1518-N6/adenine1519-N6)-dimethyltransferase [Patescibacteria group bacterium]